MKDVLAWTGENLIALGALVIAAWTWIDTRRRLRHAEIAFTVERDQTDRIQDDARFLVWNAGTRAVYHLSVDSDSVREWSMPWNITGGRYDPNEAGWFTIVPNPGGRLPDTIRLRYQRRFGGREYSYVARMPPTDGPGHAAGER